MQANDLSAEPTRRFWVMSEVVLEVEKKVVQQSSLWGLRSSIATKEVVTPDLGILARLWRWSSSLGVRLELVFVEQDVKSAPEMWQMLERGSANPFQDWLAYESRDTVAHDLPYRPDVVGVIDTPGKYMQYGGKGLTTSVVPD